MLQIEPSIGTEFIFQDKETGEMKGQILKLNNSGEIFEHSTTAELKKRLEECSSCVGRIFVGYKSEKTQVLKFRTGSGFRVSEDCVVSAEHVVEEIVLNGDTWSLEQIYIIFKVDATAPKEVNPENLKSNKRAFELKKMDRSLDKKFTSPVFIDTNSNGKEQWPYINDFSFLKFVSEKPSSKVLVALPMDPSKISKLVDEDCFVIGYPGWIDLQKFKEGYTTKPEDVNILYDTVKIQTQGFEHKAISIGKFTTFKTNYVTHRCPTLKGTSGGFFGHLKESGIRFIGVHVGGKENMENNVAIPISDPAFLYSYMTNVATKTFLDQYSKDIQPLLDYYKSLNL